MLKLVLISLLLTSCASTANDWGPWTQKTIALKKMRWETCDERFHGPEYHEYGMCFATLECRTRKTILNNTKEECRRLMLTCKWGDMKCWREWKLDEKKLMTPEE